MKKLYTALLVLLLLLSLAGCYESPAAAADVTPWEESWELIGTVMGVEAPGNGLTLMDNNGALAAMDMFYATWTIGEPVTITNEDGDEAQSYDAQLYLLADGNQTPEEAGETIESWISRYNVLDTRSATCNGQKYTLVSYSFASETNPYTRGVSAFGVYETYAIAAELVCDAEYEGDLTLILTEFLEGCHRAQMRKKRQLSATM